MKKQITVLAALLTIFTAVMAQTDYTNKITNPSFEQNGLSGWVNDGYQSQTNDVLASEGWTKHGTTYAEKWGNGALTNASLQQTVVGLPNGYYVLEADCHAVLQGETTTINGVFLCANRRTQTIRNGKTYKIGTVVSNGKLVIGIRNTNTNANWIAVDNFRLSAVDTTTIAYKSYMGTVRSVASSLRAEAKLKKFYITEELQAAITATSSAKEIEDIIRATARLEQAIAEYSAMKPHYDRLSSRISMARNNALCTNYDGKVALQSAINKATATLASEGDVAKVDEQNVALQQALNEYLQNRPSEWVTIQNGKLWKTTSGTIIQAHAPGFVRVGDLWYMVGEDRTNSWNPDVNLYSTTDFVEWKFEKKVIQNGVTDDRLGKSRMIERAKLMYNEHTGKFVIWCHWEASNYGASEAACFSCDSVNGDYKLEWSGRPLNIKSRDCNIFQDTDGTAYFISTTEENQHLGLFRLSDDYLTPKEHTRLFAWQGREAPAIVRIGNRYFMFSSACSGWAPNQCKLSYSNSLQSGWSTLNNVGNSIAYDTQAAAILEIRGTKQTTYLYVGDRWQDPDLPNTKTIMFPISFDGTSCTFKYYERFDINFVTGEWRETPTEEYFVDKTNWLVTDYSSEETNSENSPAHNAIDGNIHTKWHTKYSGTAGIAPHHITVDMGRKHIVCGFLATPRMDSSTNGLIRKYEFHTSMDGKTWTKVCSGDWLPYCTEITFAKHQCRYFKFICTEGTYASLAELDIVMDKENGTGIGNILDSGTRVKTPLRYNFFTLNGCQIPGPAFGVYIEKVFYSDGTSESVKKFGRGK